MNTIVTPSLIRSLTFWICILDPCRWGHFSVLSCCDSRHSAYLPMWSSQFLLFASSYNKLSLSLLHSSLEEEFGVYGAGFFVLSPGVHLKLLYTFSQQSASFLPSLS